MKIITIGDIHGKDFWKQVDFNGYDKAVFLGDYVDSLDHSNAEIISNPEAIIRLKKITMKRSNCCWATTIFNTCIIRSSNVPASGGAGRIEFAI